MHYLTLYAGVCVAVYLRQKANYAFCREIPSWTTCTNRTQCTKGDCLNLLIETYQELFHRNVQYVVFMNTTGFEGGHRL